MPTDPGPPDGLLAVLCNLCGSERSRVRYRSARAWPGGDPSVFAATTDRFGAFGTVRDCLDCGLIYMSPRPAPDALLGGYAANAEEEYAREADSRSMNAYLALARIRPHARAGRLLEVGCSAGYFLNAARATYEVCGVEPSRWACGFARERLGLDVRLGTLRDARFPEGGFDVAVLLDVLEHLADPVAELRELRRVLRPGGILYLVTPVIDSLSARLLRGRWWGLRPAHLYYFSRATLAAALEKTGFETVSLSSYGRIFTWGYWLSRLANYPRPVRGAAEAAVRLLGIEDKFLYLDTRDSVQAVARAR